LFIVIDNNSSLSGKEAFFAITLETADISTKLFLDEVCVEDWMDMRNEE